jgi:hypothetical protein
VPLGAKSLINIELHVKKAYHFYISMRNLGLLLLMVFVAGCHASPDRPFGRALVVSDLPVPPQQTAKWETDTNVIPPELASATISLFDEGLADPRGCDYREIEIHIGETWRGDGGTNKTHGWVLPVPAGGKPTFAICWNGLVYPVVSVGAQMDVKTDVVPMISAATTNAPPMRMALYGRAIPEKMSTAPDSLLPIKACLLLRLGEINLATNLWNACNSSLQNFRGREPEKNPYLMLAGDWTWSLFDRMICAHMRGDVPLALVSARQLSAIQPKVEAEAAQRGFKHPPIFNNGMQPPKEQPYLPFLEQLPQLLADLERRSQSPKEKSVVEMGLTNFPDQPVRIADLIEDLDLVNARQWGQPGGVALQLDPIVQALVKEGNAAVKPLLDCWDGDLRLTCSVGFGRDFFRDRHVLPVTSAAREALEEILQTQFQSPAEARAFWKQYKGLSPEERWYQVLREDSVAQEQPVRTMAAGGQPHNETMMVFGRGQWMEAARMIVQSNTITGVPAAGFYHSNSLPAGQSVKLCGESLRSKDNPSVTKLLVKNANFIAEQAEQLDQFQGVDAIQAGTELCGIINVWEKPAAAGPARYLMQRAIALWPDPNSFIMSSGHDLARDIPRLTEFRVEAGDLGALNEYAAWIKSADEEKVDEYANEAFEPLWRNPTNAAVATVAEWLFNDTNSPWRRLPWKRSTFHNPLDSDLVKLPAFQKLLVRELDDKDVFGSMEYIRPDTISYNLTDFGGGSRGITFPAGEQPALGTKVEIRKCDWIAFSLSNAKQIPFFNPFASLEIRDQAIQKAKTDLMDSK